MLFDAMGTYGAARPGDKFESREEWLEIRD